MFHFLKKKSKPPESLAEVLKELEEVKKKLKQTLQELAAFKKKSKEFLQRIGVVRFNPFQEVGGDQSFSIAIMDEKDNGVLLTSLYNRDGNRIYGKSLKNGQSPYPLSEEEKKAIEKAKNPDGN